MPTRTVWTEPEEFLTHNGVTVYHAYEDNDFDQGAQVFEFTTSSSSDDNAFDVRYLNVPSKVLLENHPPFLSATCNPDFAAASEEQKAEWQRQWKDWHKEGGVQEQAIRAIVVEAIDLGLIQCESNMEQPSAVKPRMCP